MNTISAYLNLDHKRCDDLFARAEKFIAQRSWEEAADGFRLFQEALRLHLRMEENVLLPAFVEAVPDGAAAVSLLHVEHERIRGMADRMADAISRLAAVDFALHAETYLLLLQQHTEKEEQMLYPLVDRVLAHRRDELISAMLDFVDPAFHALVS